MALIHGGIWRDTGWNTAGSRWIFRQLQSFGGVPAGVERAIREAAAYADGYPDPLCRELGAAIAQNMGTLPQRVLCGNGAADLIHRLVLARKPKRALVPVPSFAEYELALHMVGCEVIRHPLKAEHGFSLTESILTTALEPGTEMLFLCNPPHNPTGLTIDPLLQHILEPVKGTESCW